jgi:hypothetical protein
VTDLTPSWTSTAASWAARDCCTRPTAWKSAGARTTTPSRWATAAGAPSGEAVASVAATSCLLSLSAAALSKRSSRHDSTTGLGGAAVSASDAALLLPPKRGSDRCSAGSEERQQRRRSEPGDDSFPGRATVLDRAALARSRAGSTRRAPRSESDDCPRVHAGSAARRRCRPCRPVVSSPLPPNRLRGIPHKRFCERRGVRFPPATHPIISSPAWRATALSP